MVRSLGVVHFKGVTNVSIFTVYGVFSVLRKSSVPCHHPMTTPILRSVSVSLLQVPHES